MEKSDEPKKEEVKEEPKKEETKVEAKTEETKEEPKQEETKPEEKKESEEKKETSTTKETKQENSEIKKEEPKETTQEPPKEEKNVETEKKEEPIKKDEEPKIEGKPKTLLLKKFESNFDRYSPYLTDEDIFTIGKVCKLFKKPCLEKLKEINSQKLSKEESDFELVNKDDTKLVTEFSLGKAAMKAAESLNDKSHIEYFQKEEAPTEVVLLSYRVLFQLMNKEKDILKEKNDQKFWKLFRESLLKHSDNGIGNYLQNEFKNLDYSGENIHKLYNLCEGQEVRIGMTNIISKKDATAKIISFLIKEALDYIKIDIGASKSKKVTLSEAYKKYLEYIIKKRKEDQTKLEQLITKA